MVATFLPEDNAFKSCLPSTCTLYYLLKTLDNLASYKSRLRTLKIHCCVKKCVGYYADNFKLNFCPKCHECRWKLCTPQCYEDDVKNCQHSQSPRATVYYNVVQDRLVKLLKSDLKHLFKYEFYRAGKAKHSYARNGQELSGIVRNLNVWIYQDLSRNVIDVYNHVVSPACMCQITLVITRRMFTLGPITPE